MLTGIRLVIAVLLIGGLVLIPGLHPAFYAVGGLLIGEVIFLTTIAPVIRKIGYTAGQRDAAARFNAEVAEMVGRWEADRARRDAADNARRVPLAPIHTEE